MLDNALVPDENRVLLVNDEFFLMMAYGNML